VGFEWTFTNMELVEAARPQVYRPSAETPTTADRVFETTVQAIRQNPWTQAIESWKAEIKKLCPQCEIKNNTVTTPEGFWFRITLDGPVLEVLTEPMTLEQVNERSARLEQLIWGAAKKVGLRADKRLGGGHVHLDIESHFGGDRMLFRNFVVDLMNRPELFMGGFGLNYFNPPLSFYGEEAIKKFKKIVSKFDKDPNVSIEIFMEQMNDFFESLQHPILPTPYAKYQALNFKHFLKYGTLEIRGIRPHVSAEHAQKTVQILQSRIQVLKQKGKLLKVKVPDYSHVYYVKRVQAYRHFLHDLSPKKIMKSMQKYAKAAGLPRNFYDAFVTEELKKDLLTEPDIKKASKTKFTGSCKSFI